MARIAFTFRRTIASASCPLGGLRLACKRPSAFTQMQVMHRPGTIQTLSRFLKAIPLPFATFNRYISVDSSRGVVDRKCDHTGQMRTFTFYGLLAVPILAWMGIVLPNFFYESGVGISATMINAAVTLSPVVGGDLSIFGEVTPVILAGSIIALMPTSKDVKYLAVGLAVVSYLLFII
jgi:hypothetical protein